MKTTLPLIASISVDEQKNRLIECFREYWGVQQINDRHDNIALRVGKGKHGCHFIWSEKNIDIHYYCDRAMSPQEWSKIVTVMTVALDTPIPPYYLDRDEKRHRTTLRKTHRRGDNSIGCFIYPYKEEANGGWDYNVESLFIYECDFTILAAGIKACYPLNNGERAFDYTSWNEFTVAECERIISSWLDAGQENESYTPFIQYVVEWMQPLMREYDTIMIEGNL